MSEKQANTPATNDSFFGSMFGETPTPTPAPTKTKSTKKKKEGVEEDNKKPTDKKASKPKKTPPKTDNTSKEESKESSVSADDLLSASNKYGNAKVIRSAPSRSAPRGSRSSRRSPSKRSPTVRSNTRGNTGRSRTKKRSTRAKDGSFIIPKAEPTAARTDRKKATVSTDLVKKSEITIGETISVKEFSEKSGVPFPELMKVMMSNQIMGGINSAVDFDTASLIGEELGIKVTKTEESVSIESLQEGDLSAIIDLDKDAENLLNRSPIVTVMGHVDHGKTSLLDYLRKTNMAGGEAGGITQSIGASSIQHDDKMITFIDTPGHQLFTTMRARGAKLTDIAIIIVAADDGLMPQTIESINHAKEAGVPIIIAITKIDKPGANKQQDILNNMGQYDLIPESRGGDVPVIEISSMTGQGIDELLEHITLQAEMLELTYNPDRKAVGVVLDAKKSARQGVETSLIILTGTLSVGDVVVSHTTSGKIKRMIDRQGKAIKKAHGGQPVQILGISEAPMPGRIIEGVDSEKIANTKVAAMLATQETEASQQSTLQSLINKLGTEDTTDLKLILKADGPTALEALKHAVENINTPDNVRVQHIHSDIGQFTESDLALAQASGALLIGFNVNVPGSLSKKAEQQKVTLKTFDIIYQLTEYLEDIAQGMLVIATEEVVVATLNVLGIFYRKGKEMVIGGKCTDGTITNGDKFRIIRDDKQIGTGAITSLQKETQSVKTVKEGHECGMKVKCTKVIEKDDTIHFIQEKEVK